MEEETNSRSQKFESTFNSTELRHQRHQRYSELRKAKRAEIIYSKREFISPSINETSLDPEFTLSCLKSIDSDEFLKGANSLARLINETHEFPYIDLCINELLNFSSFSDINRGFISTSLLASLSNSLYSALLTKWISLIISLITVCDVKVQENLLWILGNIALDSDQNREYILNDEFLAICERLVNEQQSAYVVKKVCWCISHCCKGKFTDSQGKVLPFLCLALNRNIIDIFPEVLWALAHLSDKKVELIKEKEVFDAVVKFTKIDVVKFQQPALRVIGNLLSGSESQVSVLVASGVIRSLVYCLESKSKLIRQEAMWAFSNLCTTNYVSDLITNGIIKRIIDLSITDIEDVQTEAVWSLFNSVFISDSTQIRSLVDLGLLSALCYLLNLSSNRSKMLLLKSLEKVLKSGQEQLANPYVTVLESNGGKDTIEHLLLSKNEKIVTRSEKILKEFFEYNQQDIELIPTNHFEF